jgi:hypothetical protein
MVSTNSSAESCQFMHVHAMYVVRLRTSRPPTLAELPRARAYLPSNQTPRDPLSPPDMPPTLYRVPTGSLPYSTQRPERPYEPLSHACRPWPPSSGRTVQTTPIGSVGATHLPRQTTEHAPNAWAERARARTHLCLSPMSQLLPVTNSPSSGTADTLPAPRPQPPATSYWPSDLRLLGCILGT